MQRLILLRHGESVWNQSNRFTGWTDVDLSEKGIKEAQQAGQRLKKAGYSLDLAFTSLLKRAIKTLHLALEEMDQLWIPVEKSWRLNERHYGALQGLNKAETAEKYGEEQVRIWRRSYDVQPPALEKTDPRYPGFDPRYRGLTPDELPLTESLKNTVDRFLPLWETRIAPEISSGKTVIIAAHGNSLRALCQHLEHLTKEQVLNLEIPTGVPLIYELDSDLKPLRHYYLTE